MITWFNRPWAGHRKITIFSLLKRDVAFERKLMVMFDFNFSSIANQTRRHYTKETTGEGEPVPEKLIGRRSRSNCVRCFFDYRIKNIITKLDLWRQNVPNQMRTDWMTMMRSFSIVATLNRLNAPKPVTTCCTWTRPSCRRKSSARQRSRRRGRATRGTMTIGRCWWGSSIRYFWPG